MMRRRERGKRLGFTILELLAVMVILAALATLAGIKFGNAKRRAYLTAMRSDLRNLALIAEARYATTSSYEGVEVPRPSSGVRLTFSSTAVRWEASATHDELPGISCTASSGGGASTEPVCQ